MAFSNNKDATWFVDGPESPLRLKVLFERDYATSAKGRGALDRTVRVGR